MMVIIWILSICNYAGVRNVCTGSDVMIVDDIIVVIPQRQFYGWTSLVNVSFSIDSDLTTIEASAFQGCSNLKIINFPPKLQTIGNSAFRSCKSLLSISLPSTLSSIASYGFADCSSVTTITADEEIKVTSLVNYVFSSTSITTFEIWKRLTSIAAYAFAECQSLSTFTNPYANTNLQVINGVLYKGNALNFMPIGMTGHIIIPANVTSILQGSFRASSANSVSFEEGSAMESFGLTCFMSAKISSFDFPDSMLVTEIPSQMFRACRQLKTITIPKNIISIRSSAFYNSGLEQILVAENHPAFASVNGILFGFDLTSIIVYPPRLVASTFQIPKNVTSIRTTAFYAADISMIEFEPGSQLASLEDLAFAAIRQTSFAFDCNCSLATIPDGCFQNSKLISIVLPRNLVSIVGSAFSKSQLTEFIICGDSEYLISIEGVLYSRDQSILYRFPPAKNGADYTVPRSVKTIGTSAFGTCTQILTLTFAHDSLLRVVQSSAFESSSIVTVIFGDESDDVTFESSCFASSAVQYVTLPGSMEVIKSNLFKDCFDLVGIVLPETIRSIETSAFENCDSLTTLSIPKFCQIRTIPAGAFRGAMMLKELELPFLVQAVAKSSLPSELEKLTIWCPHSATLLNEISTIPTLTDIYILCGRDIDTDDFVGTVTLHQICVTKKLSRGRVGKPYIVMYIMYCGYP